MTDSFGGSKPLRPATLLVHGGGVRTPFGETSEALFLTQGYVFASMEACAARFAGEEPGFVYSRYGNPTVAMFEGRMALLEGAEAARATATGMAAVTASVMSQVRAGDHVVAARALFGACRYIVEDHLPRYGVASTLVDGDDLDQWRAAVRLETKVFFLESPTNPCLDVYDIAAIAKIAHDAGAILVVDNVFATPMLQKPLTLGADLVVYSATKHIDGGGRCLGGVILGAKALVEGDLQQFLRQTGPALSPFNAWVLLKALETLAIRVERQTKSAARIADFLSEQPAVAFVRYPGRADHPHADIARRQMSGGGTLVAFEIVGGKPAAFAFGRALKLIKISSNLGDAKSLITHPATTTHHRLPPEARAALGVSEGLVRLSVGLEDEEDLIDDLKAALDALQRQDIAAE
ncbi:O-succinylhomoserine sulfhydrylase [Methylocella silvestris BL2]|uniref:O-succinylhomoserine sulfhydrylase n=1 Tax=Methylocella silvestris (strain DSM 15510 / CIP 108128 / LMG 27833 / NCIMB 13906 / BL2) TaxID=395965 RepID=B8ELJ1_METSB|nr:O-succinylhomoserine sulfhydrylase [Methylocella silvestris]ACK49985.1 O-succinylhomoserine sulfhydrylase [Methylocella silvestris BL2]